jgi:CDP-glucose 4,6-dehydratase
MVNPRPSFWAGKKVLITGHTGFKGAWLAIWLSRLGAKVSGISLEADTDPNLFAQASLPDVVDHTIGDVRDAARITQAVIAIEPEIVFHLAAQSLVRKSYAHPVETFATNVIGTVHILESLRTCSSVKAAVIVTTDKCYENKDWTWPYRETDALGGRDPYSASKACAEIVTAAYCDSFLGARGIAVGTGRAGNVIGGGDWAADRLIPDCVRAFLNGRKLIIRNPDAVRPWQHVLEPLSGYLLLAEHLYDREPGRAASFNFAPRPDDVRPVHWIVTEAARLWGNDAGWTLDRAHNPHEARYLTLDASKARETLNWQARLPLAKALAWTIEWYRTVANGAHARNAMLAQIDSYMELEPSEND